MAVVATAEVTLMLRHREAIRTSSRYTTIVALMRNNGREKM
jgi:hypothetical protein